MKEITGLNVTLLDSRFVKDCNGTYRFYKVKEPGRTYYAFGLEYDPLGNSNHVVYLDDDLGRSQAAWAKMVRKLEKNDNDRLMRGQEDEILPGTTEPV